MQALVRLLLPLLEQLLYVTGRYALSYLKPFTPTYGMFVISALHRACCWSLFTSYQSFNVQDWLFSSAVDIAVPADLILVYRL